VKNRSLMFLAAPAAIALLAVLAWWFRAEQPTEGPRPRRRRAVQELPKAESAGSEPSPDHRLLKQSEEPPALPASTTPTAPLPSVPPPTPPWRPGYMGMNGIDAPGGEVVVTQVFSYTAAERAGLRVGDVVVEFNGRAVSNLATLFEWARGAGEGAPISLRIRRAGSDFYLGLQLGRHPLYN